MSLKSKIEWTEATWNPATGCSKISQGCVNCYAERLAKRLKAMGNVRYKKGFELTLHHDIVPLPLKWKQPQLVFVNSMSDLFHEKIPVSFIKDVFSTMREAHWHTFQVLTKRSARLKKLADSIDWPDNVWMGVTVESPEYLNRLDDLRGVPAAVRFISMEPLLGKFPNFSLKNIDWVVVGGESGYGYRAVEPEWVQGLRDLCVRRDVPFFFKQWGGARKKAAGRLLDGKEWGQMPKCWKGLK